MSGRRKAVLAGTVGALIASLLLAPGLVAQKKKKNSDKESSGPTIQLPDPQALETGISEMLAAWQIGDVALLKKYYADDVTIVSGAYEPPLQGWSSYVQAYQRQRERLQGVRIDRRNTLIQLKGNMAWAAYQWEMRALMDNRQHGWRGHTTLVFEKRGGSWLIVHNHTTLLETAQPVEAPQGQPGTGGPPPASQPQ